MPRETHVVEDINDKKDGHAGVQLEQQPRLQLLPRLASTKPSIWAQGSRGVSAAVVTFDFSRIF
jgi:hypothetical protein